MASTSRPRRTRAALLATLTSLAAAVGAVAGSPAAAAQPCPDVEVVFARGTGEAPGVGGTGQAFVDAVRAQAGPRTVGVYAVNYPAANDFDDRVRFAGTVVDGIRDEADHVRTLATTCPNTRVILGGYSQGAVVSGFTTVDRPPAGAAGLGTLPAPLTAQEARNVAAVVLFGTPSPAFLSQYDAPALTIGPLFVDKTLQLCAQGDTICNGAPGGGPTVAHALYPVNGMVNEGATYAVGRL